MTLEARGLIREIGGVRIVDDVSLRAPVGGVLGVLGPNGSGKSTLLRMLSGHLRPTAGDVHLDDRPLRAWHRRELARRVAIVEQFSATEEDLSVADVIDLGRIPHRPPWSGRNATDTDVVRAAAARTGVEDLLARRWHTLSGGEQQRVQLARAFAQEAGILLLDEPTNHLDIAAQLHILALARATPATVVVALHDLTLAGAFCDEILLLNRGRPVAAGTPSEVLTTEIIDAVYGIHALVDQSADGPHVRFRPPRVSW
ncbi:ABC transporter ATP-binding protein [Mobilicoccus caccae]|uniref:ABC transporter ATP-binding protein n=1 Tax=Mobilicoccus caccae TaxID=1859295 RepID=A0ABQ6IJN2_9MICO|nr:ABC transporter ATP-binding protein [Mobilicoccus caccae]GMA38060.1 ABC transporter ATP-binding protein [Mobilicoccus caccae]